MKNIFFVFFCAMGVTSSHLAFAGLTPFHGMEEAEEVEEPNFADPILKLGDQIVETGIPIYRVVVALMKEENSDKPGTVHLLATTGKNREGYFYRISKANDVKRLIEYNGVYYILDKKDNLYALNPSFATTIINKLPFVWKSFYRNGLAALGVGIVGYVAALTDQTFFGTFTGPEFYKTAMIGGGMLAYYSLYVGHTLFFRSLQTVSDGGNFFTKLIAKDVESITQILPGEVETSSKGDYEVEIRTGPFKRKRQVLSLLAITPNVLTLDNNCTEYLTKITFRR